MAARRFVIKCTGCHAPVTNVRRTCPWCANPVRLEGLGPGVQTRRDGHVTLDGAQVVVGAAEGEVRDCPYCGAKVPTKDVNCAHCGEAVVLVSLTLRSLVVEKGASLVVERGGQVVIGRPGPAPGLTRAAALGDVELVKARLRAGDDVDATAANDQTPLLLALAHGHLEVARLLIAMGANLDDADDAGLTPLHVAAQGGHGELVDVLLREGAAPRLRTKKGKKTAAQLAQEAGHAELAARLAAAHPARR